MRCMCTCVGFGFSHPYILTTTFSANNTIGTGRSSMFNPDGQFVVFNPPSIHLGLIDQNQFLHFFCFNNLVAFYDSTQGSVLVLFSFSYCIFSYIFVLLYMLFVKCGNRLIEKKKNPLSYDFEKIRLICKASSIASHKTR